ncbi:MAG TPA: PASTA domain-containing protein [Solirubrobacterales bacterium]
MRALRTIALVLVSALGVYAPAASAAPLSMTFTEGRANVGVQLEDEALFAPPDTAPFEAQIDPPSGLITAGVLEVPQFSTSITDPIVADVTVDFEIGEIEGSFTQATGALTLEGEAGGTLTATNATYEGEECFVSTTPEVLALSTATAESIEGAPRSGSTFAVGLAGPGAIAGEWTHMDAEPVDEGDPDNVSFCNNVEQQIGGKGGVWLEQIGSIVPPPPTPQPNDGTPPPPVILPPPPTCVVPNVAGMKPVAARKKIRAANCKVGKVRRPKRPQGRKGPWVLVVKSSTPAPGSKPANGTVHHRLAPKS